MFTCRAVTHHSWAFWGEEATGAGTKDKVVVEVGEEVGGENSPDSLLEEGGGGGKGRCGGEVGEVCNALCIVEGGGLDIREGSQYDERWVGVGCSVEDEEECESEGVDCGDCDEGRDVEVVGVEGLVEVAATPSPPPALPVCPGEAPGGAGGSEAGSGAEVWPPPPSPLRLRLRGWPEEEEERVQGRRWRGGGSGCGGAEEEEEERLQGADTQILAVHSLGLKLGLDPPSEPEDGEDERDSRPIVRVTRDQVTTTSSSMANTCIIETTIGHNSTISEGPSPTQPFRPGEER